MAWGILTLQMRQPPDMESSCTYIGEAVAGNQQGMVLQLGGWAKASKTSRQINMLQNVTQGLTFGKILSSDLSNGTLT